MSSAYSGQEIVKCEPVQVVAIKATPKKALEEDDYLGRMSKIIRRDFFSDTQFDGEGDLDSYRNSTRALTNTPGTGRTQYSVGSSMSRRDDGTSLSLNSFLDKYTSEDNAYFEKLQRKELRKHRLRYPWLYNRHNEYNKLVESHLKLPPASQQLANRTKVTADQPVGWPYNPRNALFYPPQQSKQEKQPKSTINYRSNNFSEGPIFKLPIHKEDRPRLVSRLKDKIGIDGNLLDGSEPSALNSYQPPAELPVRLSSVLKSESNRFYIPNESPRDQVAHRMYQERIARSVYTPRSDRTQGDTSLRSTASRRTTDFAFTIENSKSAGMVKRER